MPVDGRTRALAAVAVAAALFGTTGTARALGPGDASPLAIGAARLLVGGAGLVVVAVATRAHAPRRRHWPVLLLAGALVAVYQLAFFAALDRTGVAVGTVVTIGSGPPLAGALALLAGQGRPDRRWAAATALAVVGLAVLVDPSRGGVALGGIALALLSGLGYAGYTVVAKGLIDRGADGTAVVASAFAAGGLLLSPALVLAGAGWLAHPGGIATALYLGLVPTALAYVLFARGLTRLPAPTVTTVVLVEPVVAAILGIAVLGEEPRAGTVAGCVLIAAGLALIALPRRTAVPA